MMDSSGLFRQEVLDTQSTTWLGNVRLATPISHKIWAIVAVLITLILSLWLYEGRYTRREHVTGSLVPTAGLVTAVTKSVGVITKVNVHEGDKVHTGEVLLTLSLERSSLSKGDTAADVSTQLDIQKARLKADLSASQDLSTQQASDLHKQEIMLRSQTSQIDAQITLQQRKSTDLASLLGRFRLLGNKGFVSALEIQQQQNQLVDTKEQIAELFRQRAQEQQQLATTSDQLVQLPLTTEQKLNEIYRELAETEEAFDQNELERETVLRATCDGTVSSILVKPGQAVLDGQSVLITIPRSSRLQAQLLVPSSAIGFVHVGSNVILHYDAFPYQKFGIRRGKIATISRAALTPIEVSNISGGPPPNKPLYLVKVRLNRQTIKAYGVTERLKPGMNLEADILLDKRRMIEWLFEPLYGMDHRNLGAIE